MPGIGAVLRANAPYAFIVVGVVWLAVAILTGSALILWPVFACIAGGVLLRMRPSGRLTWAWAISTAVLGLLLSAYQVYAWAPFLGGAFSSVAAVSVACFTLLAIAHLFLFYAGIGKPSPTKEPIE